jgi:purine-binding chemotaxis protein CheW
MAGSSAPATPPRELVLFVTGSLLCGLDVAQVQEISRELAVTPVHRAPPYVRGVLNLRGQLLTVIDLRRKLGVESSALAPGMRIVVVKAKRGVVGLLVDSVADIVRVEPSELQPPPANLKEVSGDYFAGVYLMERGLAAVLDLETVLRS